MARADAPEYLARSQPIRLRRPGRGGGPRRLPDDDDRVREIN